MGPDRSHPITIDRFCQIFALTSAEMRWRKIDTFDLRITHGSDDWSMPRFGIKRIVDDGYAIILADDRIKDDFDNINPDHIKPRLIDLICQLSGGPCIYKGRPMAAAHEGLDLTQAKFNALAEDMQTGMQNLGIPYWTQNRLMALLAPMQRDIVRE